MANEYIAGGKDALVEKQYAFDRSFDVIVIKQIPPTRSDLSTAIQQFNAKYAEFLTTVRNKLDFVIQRKEVILQELLSVKNSTGYFPIYLNTSQFGTTETTDFSLLYGNARYIDTIALGIVDLTRPAWMVRVRSSKIDGIEDILSASVRLSVSGTGQASITIKNDLDRYCFRNNDLLLGKTIFEPDDIVVVRLPDRDANLNVCFTGYINQVQRNRAPAQNTITLECEDVTKRLRYSRVAIQKALLDRDQQAHFVPLSAFVFPWVQGEGGEAEAVQKIISSVGVLALSTIYNLPDLSANVNQYNSLYKERNVFSVQPSFSTAIPGVVGVDTKGIEEQIGVLRETIEKDRLGFTELYIDLRDSVGMSAKGVKVFKNTKATVLAQEENFIKKPVMIIDGTNQPAYTVAFRNGFNLWMSEWKEANRLCHEFANTVNFEFFANEEGIIRFRPVNTTLSHLLDPTDVHILHDYNIYQQNTYEDNTEIASVAVATGDWKVRLGTSLDSLGIFGYIKDNRLIQKYGDKMTSLQPVIGLTTNAALNVWASSVLNRINSKAFAGGSVEVVGDSRYRVGTYVLLESNNMLFYIDSIEHTISPGGSYRVRLSLTYRRMPVYDVAQLFASQVGTSIGTLYRATTESKRTLARNFLDSDVAKNKTFTRLTPLSINLSYRNVVANLENDGYSADELQHIYNPTNSFASPKLASSLSLFYCAGYIWEFGVDIDFNDALLIQEAFEKGLSAADLQNQRLRNTKNKGMQIDTNFDKTNSMTGQVA